MRFLRGVVSCLYGEFGYIDVNPTAEGREINVQTHRKPDVGEVTHPNEVIRLVVYRKITGIAVKIDVIRPESAGASDLVDEGAAILYRHRDDILYLPVQRPGEHSHLRIHTTRCNQLGDIELAIVSPSVTDSPRWDINDGAALRRADRQGRIRPQ